MGGGLRLGAACEGDAMTASRGTLAPSKAGFMNWEIAGIERIWKTKRTSCLDDALRESPIPSACHSAPAAAEQGKQAKPTEQGGAGLGNGGGCKRPNSEV